MYGNDGRPKSNLTPRTLAYFFSFFWWNLFLFCCNLIPHNAPPSSYGAALSFGIQNRAIHQSTLEFDFCRTTDDQGQEPKNKRTGKNMSVLKQQIYFVATQISWIAINQTCGYQNMTPLPSRQKHLAQHRPTWAGKAARSEFLLD